jgi:thiol-disulfide isomerase/thioredoxin
MLIRWEKRSIMKRLLATRLALILAAGLAPAACFRLRAAEGEGQAATTMKEIKLESLKWPQFRERLAAMKPAKYTLVDAWATTCAPCKENFPHLVQMHQKYASKGLAVISLCLDDATDKKAVSEAEKFLKEKNAVFTNILLDENFGEGFDKLDVSTIPAVFIFGQDGKEVKRFTMDDPSHQFTYDQVEKYVIDLFGPAKSASAGS